MPRMTRPSCLNAIFRWRSLTRRGPSTISTRWCGTPGADCPRRTAPAWPFRTPRARRCRGSQRPVDPQPRTQVVGLQARIGIFVHARPQFANARRIHRQPGGLLVPAELGHHIARTIRGRQHVERRDAAAGSVCHVAVDRQHDGRPMEGVHELRGDDADDAAMPAFAGDHDAPCASRPRGRYRRSCWPAATISASSCWRRMFSASSCSASSRASSAIASSAASSSGRQCPACSSVRRRSRAARARSRCDSCRCLCR